MNIFLVILFFSMSLEVPDSVFNPRNALRVKTPEWVFPEVQKNSNFMELGYSPLFKLRYSNFSLGVLEEYDYDKFYRLKNKYFFASRYFAISHNASGMWRSENNAFFIVQDTLDVFFSYGRFIPDLSLLPYIIYIKRDSSYNLKKHMETNFSVTYSSPEGIIFFATLQNSNMFEKKELVTLMGGGVGIMNPRKFVAIGLYSNLVPEIAIRALLPGGTYFDLHYKYSTRELYPFRYLYPAYSFVDTLPYVMGKDFNLLLEKSPYMFSVDYFVPDSIYSRTLYAKFTFEKSFGGFSYEYYKVLGSGIVLLGPSGSNNVDMLYLRLFPRPLSRGGAFAKLPLTRQIVVIPEVDMIRDMWSRNTVYTFSPRLKYERGRIEVFLEVINLYNYGEIRGIQPKDGILVGFFNKRRFRIGAKYSF